MRKSFARAAVLTAFLLLLAPISIKAQTLEVTKFLGIPVDGSKEEMIDKLREKGFTYRTIGETDWLEGEFNGMQSTVHIVTNRNKVRRIGVNYGFRNPLSSGLDEHTAKLSFNRLVFDFYNSRKYTSLGAVSSLILQNIDEKDYSISKPIEETLTKFLHENELIPEEEDISFEMSVRKKGYQRDYFQKDMESVRQALDGIGPEYRDDEYVVKAFEQIGIFIPDVIVSLVHKTDEEYWLFITYINRYNEPHGEDL